MLFRDADFYTECEADMGHGSTLLLSDILCAGRVGRGEEFAFHNYRNRLAVRYEGELIFCNQTRFEPQRQNLRAVGAWGTSTHWGNFYVFSSEVDSCLVDALREVLDNYPNVNGGVSLTHKNGVAVSVLANSAWPIEQCFQTLRLQLRRNLWNL
jgi:urease accessory protein